MKLRITVVASLLALGTFFSSAHATTINFDDGISGSAVGSYYSGQGVTFSNALFTSNFGLLGASGSLGIIAQNNGGLGNSYQWLQANAVSAAITSGASSVSITGIDVGLNGLRIDAYDALVGGSLVDFEQVFGTDVGVSQFFTLTSAASSIMRVEIYQVQNIMGDGIVLDNFSFEPSGSAPVPEPSTMLLLGSGLAGLAFWRKRKAAKMC